MPGPRGCQAIVGSLIKGTTVAANVTSVGLRIEIHSCLA